MRAQAISAGLIDGVLGHAVGRHVQLAATETLAIVVADVRAESHAVARGRCAGHAHGVRIAGVKAAGHAGAGHHAQQGPVTVGSALADVGVEVDLRSHVITTGSAGTRAG